MKVFRFLIHLLTFVCSNGISRVKIFGDSILASNTPIQEDIESWSGIKIENYATIGSGLQSGWVVSIPEQYNKYKSPVPHTIIMDGGGNDMNSARSQCVGFTDSCKKIVDHLVGIAGDLIHTMRKDNVTNIVYSGFYYIPEFQVIIDYASEELKKVCQPKDYCYFVDLRNVKVERAWDGLHPVTESYHAIAKEIWNTIQQYNVTLS